MMLEKIHIGVSPISGNICLYRHDDERQDDEGQLVRLRSVQAEVIGAVIDHMALGWDRGAWADVCQKTVTHNGKRYLLQVIELPEGE